MKRLQRAGLPIYPPEVCLKVYNGYQESQNMGTMQAGDGQGRDLMQTDHFKIPEVEFKNLELNRGVLSYSSGLFDTPATSRLKQGLGSSHGCGFVSPTMRPSKRLRESEPIFPGLDGSVSCGIPVFNQLIDYPCGKITEHFGLSSSYNSDLSTYEQPSWGVPGSPAIMTGNSCSSSEPISGAVKLELPSLQYAETQDSWGTPVSSLPSLESVDTLIQTPPTKQTQSDCLSPRSSGLLEAVLYESQTLKNSDKCSGHQTSQTSDALGDAVEGSSSNPCKTGWEVHGDPNSPLGHSAASLFSECTPISGSSADDRGEHILDA